MNLINVATLEYPRNLWQLRQENPNVSFPAEPTDDDLRPFDHAIVHPTAPPACDPRTERAEDSLEPHQADDGTWQQAWVIRPATEDECAAYDAANAPPAQWMEFGIALATTPDVSQLLDALPSAVASAVSIGLSDASKGDARLFLGLWRQISSRIDADLMSQVMDAAIRFNLPSDFRDGLMAGRSTH